MYYVCVVQLRCHHAVQFLVALFDLCGLLGFLALHGVKGSVYMCGSVLAVHIGARPRRTPSTAPTAPTARPAAAHGLPRP